MTLRLSISLLIMMVLLLACQQQPQYVAPATAIPFPTMTVGQRVSGALGTPGARPQFVLPGQANPATAAAIINQPAPTPDTSNCPTSNADADLGGIPGTRNVATERIMTFLNSGGTGDTLRDEILTEWDAFGENGYLRDDVDLTGEGRGDIILGYVAPGDVGSLLIFGCQDGRYVNLFEAIADGAAPPELIWLGEMNNGSPAEIVFARRICADAEFCEFQTQIVGWSGQTSRMVNLLLDTVRTLDVPSVRDMDNDSVVELVVNLNNNGTADTGPLRTGVNIYDWNGEFYLLSIIQLNEPRYHIQAVHDGDIAFSNLRMGDAIESYEFAVREDDLRFWFNDGGTTVISYALYRLMLAHAYLGNGGNVLDAYTRLIDEFPPDEETGEATVYVAMASAFIDTLRATNNLNASCRAVQTVISERDEALGFLNRYGRRSPTYTALDLCPF